MPPFSEKDDRLQIGSTVLSLVAAVMLLASASEAGLRLLVKPAQLLPATYRIEHIQFGYKIEALDQLVTEHGGVDCIFLGSSLAYRGIDPQTYGEIYREMTGQNVNCFNFGLAGLRARDFGPIGELLVNRYHPSTLIYGTSLRDFTEEPSDSGQSRLLNEPWVRYQLGSPSLPGWLDINTLSHRYFFAGAHYYRFGFVGAPNPHIRENGFRPRAVEENEAPVVQALPAGLVDMLSQYESMSTDDVQGLRHLLGLQANGIGIVLVELPLPSGYQDYLPDGTRTYASFLDELQGIADEGDVLLLRVDHTDYGEELWSDYHHLNELGAIEFSTWLATEIASLED